MANEENGSFLNPELHEESLDVPNKPFTSQSYSTKLKSPKWQRKRLEIYQRDDWKCRHCGSDEMELNVHHIGYIGEPWDAPNELLLTLCIFCHMREEEKKKNEVQAFPNNFGRLGFTSLHLSSLNDALKKVLYNDKNPDKIIRLIKSLNHE